VAATALEIALNGYSDLLIEAKALEVKSADTTLREVQGKLAQLEKTRRMEAAIAQAEIDFSRSRVVIFNHRLAASTLKAPTGGVVVFQSVWMNGQKKKVQVGDEVRATRPFMEVADVSAIVIKTNVEEVDIGRVKPGLPVRIRVDSVNKTFDGKLASIGVLATIKPNLVNTDGAPRVFEALVETDAHSSAFRPGMTVDLETEVRRIPDALTVPNKALATLAGQTTVFVRRPDGAIEKRVVETSEHDDTRTVVTSGLKAGETILVERPL
jgi:HlyD family secretion protein